MSPEIAGPDVDRFYRAAMLALGMLDTRGSGARRFGPDADARWDAFKGGLREWHRIDLLVRDASVRHPAGFAPRVVFELPSLAEDEASGPDWRGAAPTEANDLLRTAKDAPSDISAALAAVAAVWNLRPTAPGAASLADVTPSTKLLLSGPGAVLAAANTFSGQAGLDLSDQATLVADDPGTRQLFGIALALLDARRPPRLVRSSATADDLRACGVVSFDRLVMGSDVPSDTRGRVESLARELGARIHR